MIRKKVSPSGSAVLVQSTRTGKTRPDRELLPPGPRRVKPSVKPSVWGKLKEYVARIGESPETRAHRIQKKASAASHEAVQQLLLHLTLRPLTQEEIDAHVLRFTTASQALTKSATPQATEAKARRLFTQSLQMHVALLPPDVLKCLRARADQAPEGPSGAVLRDVGRQVDAARLAWVARLNGHPQMARIMVHFDRALKFSAAGDRDSAQDQLSQAKGSAAQLLQQLGLLKPGEDAFEKGEALLKEVCAQWMQGRDTQQLDPFFQAIPASMQALWQKADSQHLNVSTADVDARLANAIQHTEKALSRALKTACKTALSAPWSDTLRAAADAWTALKNYCKAFDRPPGDAEEVMPLLATLVQKAAELDLSDVLGSDTMTDQQLHDLHEALKTLGIPHDAQAFASEIAARQETSQELFILDLHGALGHLAARDLAGALNYLRYVDEHFESLVPIHEALTGRRLDVEGRTELAYQLFQKVLGNASPPTLEKAFDTINDEQTRLLAQVLMDMGQRAKVDDATAALSRIGTNLLLLKDALAQQLQKTHEVKSLSDEQVRLAAGVLDRATFAIAYRFSGERVQRPTE